MMWLMHWLWGMQHTFVSSEVHRMPRSRLKRPTVDRSGEKHHRWTLLRFDSFYRKGTVTDHVYVALCECGTKKKIRWGQLKQGKTKQCRACGIKTMQHAAPTPPRGAKNPNYRGTKDVPMEYYGNLLRNAAARGYKIEISIEDLQRKWEE